MIITIHQPQYLPWLGYFDKIAKADIFILLDNVQFKKNEWQNRNRIRTPEGWQWLTVPVLHHFGDKINETKINNKEPWRKKHLRALELNYSKAPFFAQYYPRFQEGLNHEWDNLSDLNVYFVGMILDMLKVKTKTVLASEYEATEHKTLRLVDLCKTFKAQTYLSGQGGQDYLDVEQFKINNIDIVIQKYEHPVYNQMWQGPKSQGFISHLSIIDLIFNSGPESLRILSSGEKQT
ncbi:MAG: WbqC family protein [Candidatus Omnitrophica bacterium]|nr:WbqC family protein [Candidatus Omnitrophota bacterium]